MVREGYKQTEVGLIPEDWETFYLGEIGQSFIGLTYRPEDTREFGTLVLRSSNVQNDQLSYKNNVFVDSSLPLPSRVIVEKGDILICVRNGSKQLIGKCALIDAEAAGSAFGAFMSIFRTKFSGFVFYQFQSEVIQRQINEIMGATINQITTKDLVSFRIPLPPSKEEQNAIAATLSDVDALIASLDKLIAKQRHLKTATMQQLLTGKKRLPGFGEGKGYKQTEVGLIPEDWVIKPLKTISSMSGRIGWQGLKQEEFTFRDIDPFLITGMNFKDGKIRWEEVYHIPEKRYQEAKNIQLQDGDILMTKDGTIGKLLYVEDIPFPGKASLNSHLLVFRPLNNCYEPKFLFYQLSSKQFADFIDLNKSGSTFFGITQEAVEKYNVYLTSTDEQRAIATVLSDMDAAISALETRRAKTQAIKQGMMQQLLTGRVRLV